MIYSGNRYLTRSEMTNNAQYILDFLTARGWTKTAICGMLGNMETESTINPAIWQSLNYGNLSGGYGLTQWTPCTKYFNWCDERNLTYGVMDNNLKRILYEVDNNLQWYSYEGEDPPFSFYEYTLSDANPAYLANIFLRHYEQPNDIDQPDRYTQAVTWFETLTAGTTKTKKKSSFMYYMKRRYKEV